MLIGLRVIWLVRSRLFSHYQLNVQQALNQSCHLQAYRQLIAPLYCCLTASGAGSSCSTLPVSPFFLQNDSGCPLRPSFRHDCWLLMSFHELNGCQLVQLCDRWLAIETDLVLTSFYAGPFFCSWRVWSVGVLSAVPAEGLLLLVASPLVCLPAIRSSNWLRLNGNCLVRSWSCNWHSTLVPAWPLLDESQHHHWSCNSVDSSPVSPFLEHPLPWRLLSQYMADRHPSW